MVPRSKHLPLLALKAKPTAGALSHPASASGAIVTTVTATAPSNASAQTMPIITIVVFISRSLKESYFLTVSSTILHNQRIFIIYDKEWSKNYTCHRIQKPSISNEFYGRKEKRKKERAARIESEFSLDRNHYLADQGLCVTGKAILTLLTNL
jgi:hypothetical protein